MSLRNVLRGISYVSNTLNGVGIRLYNDPSGKTLFRVKSRQDLVITGTVKQPIPEIGKMIGVANIAYLSSLLGSKLYEECYIDVKKNEAGESEDLILKTPKSQVVFRLTSEEVLKQIFEGKMISFENQKYDIDVEVDLATIKDIQEQCAVSKNFDDSCKFIVDNGDFQMLVGDKSTNRFAYIIKGNLTGTYEDTSSIYYQLETIRSMCSAVSALKPQQLKIMMITKGLITFVLETEDFIMHVSKRGEVK